MKDLGKLSWFLGIKFTFENDCISMDQSGYLRKVLDRFKMTDCNIKNIPCDLNTEKFSCTDHSNELSDSTLYCSIVGSLIYAMTNTRPDLAYVVTYLSQHMSKPFVAHFNIAKFVLKYIKGSIDYKLKFSKSDQPLHLTGYTDSDWGRSTDRKSISGFCFLMNDKGCLVSWKSRKQSIVALSTCEAEYIALAAAVQEAKFLKQLYADMMHDGGKIITMYVDNQSAIKLAKNPVLHQRSKHIDIRYHYLRSEVKCGNIEISYVPSADNISDIFTKPVSKVKLDKFTIIRGN